MQRRIDGRVRQFRHPIQFSENHLEFAVVSGPPGHRPELVGKAAVGKTHGFPSGKVVLFNQKNTHSLVGQQGRTG